MTHSLGPAIRDFAASLPDAWVDHPWGDTVYKVGKKIFIFLGDVDDDGGRIGVKLREAHEEAMAFEWVTPSGYGLDRGGWVSCTIPRDAPLEMVLGWIEESYRLVAPRKLVSRLDGGG
jgi:predicted DNA-binding protein (MmcQ/YjbR family)